MKTTLFTMLGYPGSGKSHFAKQLAIEIHATWLNNDGMRSSIFEQPTATDNLHNYAVVYGAMDYATNQALLAGMSVIYDANVNHAAEREKNANIAKAHNADAITIWVKTSIAEAKERVVRREATDVQFKLDPESVDKHVARVEEPTDEEKCIVIDGVADFADQLASFRSQLKELQ